VGYEWKQQLVPYAVPWWQPVGQFGKQQLESSTAYLSNAGARGSLKQQLLIHQQNLIKAGWQGNPRLQTLAFAGVHYSHQGGYYAAADEFGVIATFVPEQAVGCRRMDNEQSGAVTWTMNNQVPVMWTTDSRVPVT
jgi:hypothetical protein